MFFDSHCHLTAPQLARQLPEVLQRARAADVTMLLNIGDNLASSQAAQAQAQQTSAIDIAIWSTAGIHPQHAAEFDLSSASTLNTLREYLSDPRCVAVGEIGLDFFYDETHAEFPGAPRSVQEEVLRAQLQLAAELDLPVVLHNRDADARLLPLVQEFPTVRGVFHCFSSTQEIARQVLDAGFFLSFTGLITFKNADSARETARFCPLDRVLIETDSPYLAPVPHRGQTNEPAFVPLVAQTLAALHQRPCEEIAQISAANTRRLFRLDTATI